MKNKIEVTIRSVYGQELVYPMNELAKQMVGFMGKKTFSELDIKRMKEMGFEIERVQMVSKEVRYV